MYEYAPIFVPSNLETTWLHIRIMPGASRTYTQPCTLRYSRTRRDGTPDHAEFTCNVFMDAARDAQRAIFRLSKKHSKDHRAQSDRVYILPLFADVDYDLHIDPSRKSGKPTTHVTQQERGPHEWHCEIHASNLIQMQAAVFEHRYKIYDKEREIIGGYLRELEKRERSQEAPKKEKNG